MVPFARPGDAFLVEAGVNPRFGDIVLAIVGGRAVTHRLIRRRQNLLITKGDASPVADPAVKTGQVLGVATRLVTADGVDISLLTGRGRCLAVVLGCISRCEASLAPALPPPRTRAFFYLLRRALLLLIRS